VQTNRRGESAATVEKAMQLLLAGHLLHWAATTSSGLYPRSISSVCRVVSHGADRVEIVARDRQSLLAARGRRRIRHP